IGATALGAFPASQHGDGMPLTARGQRRPAGGSAERSRDAAEPEDASTMSSESIATVMRSDSSQRDGTDTTVTMRGAFLEPVPCATTSSTLNPDGTTMTFTCTGTSTYQGDWTG